MRFPRAGRYTLWCEFGLERAKIVAPFEVEIESENEIATCRERSASNRDALKRENVARKICQYSRGTKEKMRKLYGDFLGGRAALGLLILRIVTASR